MIECSYAFFYDCFHVRLLFNILRLLQYPAEHPVVVIEEVLGVLAAVVEGLGTQLLDGWPDFYLHLVFVVGLGIGGVGVGYLQRDGIAVGEARVAENVAPRGAAESSEEAAGSAYADEAVAAETGGEKGVGGGEDVVVKHDVDGAAIADGAVAGLQRGLAVLVEKGGEAVAIDLDFAGVCVFTTEDAEVFHGLPDAIMQGAVDDGREDAVPHHVVAAAIAAHIDDDATDGLALVAGNLVLKPFGLADFHLWDADVERGVAVEVVHLVGSVVGFDAGYVVRQPRHVEGLRLAVDDDRPRELVGLVDDARVEEAAGPRLLVLEVPAVGTVHAAVVLGHVLVNGDAVHVGQFGEEWDDLGVLVLEAKRQVLAVDVEYAFGIGIAVAEVVPVGIHRMSHSHGVTGLVGADMLVVAGGEGAEDDVVETAVAGHGVDVVPYAPQFLGDVDARHTLAHGEVRHLRCQRRVQLVVVLQHLLLGEGLRCRSEGEGGSGEDDCDNCFLVHWSLSVSSIIN